uniref:WRKY domain-containing protein n=1 Tax=Leersia perrieri TaxID=77586 RepID=A0A0D9XVF0_9ORYZ
MEGAMFSLPARLDGLLLPLHGSILPKGAEEEIPLIKRDLDEIISILHGHKEAEEDHANDSRIMWMCWMKEVRELSYDIEDCIDQFEHAAAPRYRSRSLQQDRRRKWLSRQRGKKQMAPWVPEKLKQRLWMANKIREFSLRSQEAIQRYAMCKNLSGIGTDFTTRGDVSITPCHPKRFNFKEHADNVRLADAQADIDAALKKVNNLKNLLPADSAHIVADIEAALKASLKKLKQNMLPGTPTSSTTRGHVGIDSSMSKLENWLAVCGEEKLKVVSIVGVGGVGKTTLANELYCKLRWQFECRAFVRTSKKPDIRRILISMLSQVRPHQPPDNWKVHDLISSIRTHLQDKRYLIIIDDLWATSTWDIIKCTLPDGNSCSRILITTEIEDLALQFCSYDSKNIFKMKPLGEDDSRTLFFSSVFGSHSNCPPELSEASYDIVRKCGGLPLAIVTIAGLLVSKLQKQEQWDCINKSLGYSLMANPNLEGMKQLLNFCYNNLPQHLRACMLYLSMYQEDTIIWKDDLVNQWIAEGFICAIEVHNKEEILSTYFDELLGRKIVQPVHINDNGEVLSCVVHHMVLNFITHKSIEENFIVAIDHSQATTRLADKVRRLSFHFGHAEDETPTNMRLSQVRTLALFGVLNLMSFITGFRLLKVLILHFWGDEDSISFDLTKVSELALLRYLKVTSNVTLKLPMRMQGLQYLETLKINGKIGAVPSDIVHLPCLLHLSLPAKTNLPNGIVHMTSLRTLGYFDLSCNSTENLWSLGELINLQDLQLAYSAIQFDNLNNNVQYLGSILGKLRNLKFITLSPTSSLYENTLHTNSGISVRISVDGWSSLSSPPALLQTFDLLPCVCIFSSLPNWIGQLRNLCILKIGIREVTNNDVDVLGGLLALTVLSLYVHTKPAERIVFGNVGFSILKYFKFRCSLARIKFDAGTMPCLQKLKLDFNVHRADQHDTIPIGIEHLSRLEEISAKIRVACSADDLSKRFAESALTNAIKMHSGCPRVNIRSVDWTFDGKDDISVGTREEEHRTLVRQDHTVKEGPNEISAGLQKHSVKDHIQLKTQPKERIQVRVSSMVDDGFSWIKYGEKDILGAKYTRSYFQCTHRESKGCLATKQVQPTDGDPLILDTLMKKSTQVRVSSLYDALDDGHSWRKYGQKDIQGSMHPRCTHRNSQGCQATKQVHRNDDDPQLFDVVYHGDHTCHQMASFNLNEQTTWWSPSSASLEQSQNLQSSSQLEEQGSTVTCTVSTVNEEDDLLGGHIPLN